MPKWVGLLFLYTSLALANDVNVKPAEPLYEYFVVEVLSSETVYEPVAEYRYHVRPLGNVSGLTDMSFPTRFSTDVVLSKNTVGAGYWMLAKINRRTGQVYEVDVTKPEIGFADSPYFLQVFYDRLENAMAPVRESLIKGYKAAKVKVSLGVADDFSIQAKYNQPNNNLALVAIDYYVDTIIPDFAQFFCALRGV